MSIKFYIPFLVLPILLWSCGNPSAGKPEAVPTVAALPKVVKAPMNNPNTAEKAHLGKLLFYDPILSGGKDISCVSCHHPATG
ncbi:cytochrome c peroxidase, partial [Cellulophaga baltica]